MDSPVIRPMTASGDPLTDATLLDAYAMPVGRPWLRVNFVSSVDGSATLQGRSGTLGDAADRLVLGLLRVQCDALMVASGTLRHEGYGPLRLSDRQRGLRQERGRAEHLTLVVVTRRLDMDPTHPLFSQAPVRPVVLTTEESSRERGAPFASVADIVTCGESEVDLAEGLKQLHGMGLSHILCEGGPILLGSLLAADLVDELCLTVAPKLVGAGAGRIVAGPPSEVREMALSHALLAGDELLLRYTRLG